FPQAVAPLQAARLHGMSIPSASSIAHKKPSESKALLIETFGSPFSPLNEDELQIQLIETFALPSVLVASSTIGPVGRTLQCLLALEGHDVVPRGIALVGARDDFAVEQIRRQRPSLTVFSFQPPPEWTTTGVARAAAAQAGTLRLLRTQVQSEKPLIERETQ